MGTVYLWGEAILLRFLPGLVRDYLVACGILFNVCVLILLFWG